MIRYLGGDLMQSQTSPCPWLTKEAYVRDTVYHLAPSDLPELQTASPPVTSRSLHIAAPITATKVVPASTVKAMCRWSSLACQRYVHPELKEIISAQKAMSKTFITGYHHVNLSVIYRVWSLTGCQLKLWVDLSFKWRPHKRQITLMLLTLMVCLSPIPSINSTDNSSYKH